MLFPNNNCFPLLSCWGRWFQVSAIARQLSPSYETSLPPIFLEDKWKYITCIYTVRQEQGCGNRKNSAPSKGNQWLLSLNSSSLLSKTGIFIPTTPQRVMREQCSGEASYMHFVLWAETTSAERLKQWFPTRVLCPVCETEIFLVLCHISIQV